MRDLQQRGLDHDHTDGEQPAGANAGLDQPQGLILRRQPSVIGHRAQGNRRVWLRVLCVVWHDRYAGQIQHHMHFCIVECHPEANAEF